MKLIKKLTGESYEHFCPNRKFNLNWKRLNRKFTLKRITNSLLVKLSNKRETLEI